MDQLFAGRGKILKNVRVLLPDSTQYGVILLNAVMALIYIGDCIRSLKEK
jgi:hypothetical protein